MHTISDGQVLLFLIQLVVLLGVARTLGVIAEHFKLPALAGEILAGVLLGPTVLGRISPGLQAGLFPHEPIQSAMLETVSWLGVFFLLLSSGFHVHVGDALRKGRAALSVGIVGVVVPVAIGMGVFWFLDPRYWGPQASRFSFSLFLAVAASITAISVVARTLTDLKLQSAPCGSVALAACAVNDLFGWLLFTVVISLASAVDLDAPQLALTAFGVMGFVAACLFLGSRVLSMAARWVQATSLPQPAATMTLVASAGLLCGAITQWLGIHAILGFFLAGTMAGSAEAISEKVRHSLSETFHAVFVPLFFATLGIHVDFVTGMELWITALFMAVAVGGKFVGAWIGARMARLDRPNATLMGLIFTPGGAMEIVVGTLALELQLISESVWVAIVFAALVSSITVGPLVSWMTRRSPGLIVAPATEERVAA